MSLNFLYAIIDLWCYGTLSTEGCNGLNHAPLQLVSVLLLNSSVSVLHVTRQWLLCTGMMVTGYPIRLPVLFSNTMMSALDMCTVCTVNIASLTSIVML